MSKNRRKNRTKQSTRRLTTQALESRRLLAAGSDDLASLIDEFDDASTISAWTRIPRTRRLECGSTSSLRHQSIASRAHGDAARDRGLVRKLARPADIQRSHR